MNKNKKKAIIFDIDGTLAKHPQRGHHEYNKISSDIPNRPIILLYKMLAESYYLDFEFIIVSGRPDWAQFKNDTKNWLFDQGIDEYTLFMRPHEDNRNDAIVKKEIYERYIQPKYEVLFWIDDRDRVVKMVREELGITCLQVDYGNF